MLGATITQVISTVLPGSAPVGATESVVANLLRSVQAAITAHAGGGQANAVPITALQFEIGVCATLHDSVILPKATPGIVIYGANKGVAGADVYPATGEQINNAGANAIFALANGKNAIFFCVAAGNWYAILTA